MKRHGPAMVTKKEAQDIKNQVAKRKRDELGPQPGQFKLTIKQGHSDNLSLDDLLQDLKRHVGQANIILGLLNQRGALSNGRELIRSYSNLFTILSDPPCNLIVTGEPTDIQCYCPDWWFPPSVREKYKRTRANDSLHHHEQCPIQLEYLKENK